MKRAENIRPIEPPASGYFTLTSTFATAEVSTGLRPLEPRQHSGIDANSRITKDKKGSK